MITRLARVAVWVLRIVAAGTYLYHFGYCGWINPGLTQNELAWQKWPWIVAGFGLVIAGETIDLGLCRRRRRDDAEAAEEGG